RLVQQYGDGRGPGFPGAVDGDLNALGHDGGRGIGDDGAVDRDAPVENQGAGLAPAGEAQLGDRPLERDVALTSGNCQTGGRSRSLSRAGRPWRPAIRLWRATTRAAGRPESAPGPFSS